MATIINHRIKAIADALFNGSVANMSDAMAIKRSTLYSITGKTKATPGFDVISRIANWEKPRISMEWLIRGTGDMLETSQTTTILTGCSTTENQNGGQSNRTKGNIATQNIYNGTVQQGETDAKTLTDTIATLARELEASQQQKSRLIEIIDRQLSQYQQLADLLHK